MDSKEALVRKLQSINASMFDLKAPIPTSFQIKDLTADSLGQEFYPIQYAEDSIGHRCKFTYKLIKSQFYPVNADGKSMLRHFFVWTEAGRDKTHDSQQAWVEDSKGEFFVGFQRGDWKDVRIPVHPLYIPGLVYEPVEELAIRFGMTIPALKRLEERMDEEEKRDYNAAVKKIKSIRMAGVRVPKSCMIVGDRKTDAYAAQEVYRIHYSKVVSKDAGYTCTHGAPVSKELVRSEFFPAHASYDIGCMLRHFFVHRDPCDGSELRKYQLAWVGDYKGWFIKGVRRNDWKDFFVPAYNGYEPEDGELPYDPIGRRKPTVKKFRAKKMPVRRTGALGPPRMENLRAKKTRVRRRCSLSPPIAEKLRAKKTRTCALSPEKLGPKKPLNLVRQLKGNPVWACSVGTVSSG